MGQKYLAIAAAVTLIAAASGAAEHAFAEGGPNPDRAVGLMIAHASRDLSPEQLASIDGYLGGLSPEQLAALTQGDEAAAKAVGAPDDVESFLLAAFETDLDELGKAGETSSAAATAASATAATTAAGTATTKATAPKPARKANARTAAKVPARAAAQPGARARRMPSDEVIERDRPDVEYVLGVLTTSQVAGPNGRRIARRTLVRVPEKRAEDLANRGWLREPTKAELDAADKASVITLDA